MMRPISHASETSRLMRRCSAAAVLSVARGFVLATERAQIPLLAQRHDVILYGGAILLYLADALAIQAFSASDRDVMEGFARAVMR